MTGFDLFGMVCTEHFSQTIALLGVHFDLTSGSRRSECLFWQYVVSLPRWYITWLRCALCKLAGSVGVVAAHVAFSVTALIQTML